MQLTRFSDLSLRLLMYLALHEDRPWCTIHEVAEAYDISAHHLAKVGHMLGQEGLIETRRGRSGGLRLALSPRDIDIGSVLRRTERDSPLVECFHPPTDACAITPACVLQGHLARARDAFFEALDGVTLADLVVRPAPLLRLLHR